MINRILGKFVKYKMSKSIGEEEKLQKLITLNPNRIDLKLKLMSTQKMKKFQGPFKPVRNK